MGSESDEKQSPIEFVITPNLVKIPASNQAVMLNISAKLKNSYMLEFENPTMQRSNSMHSSSSPSQRPLSALQRFNSEELS